MTNKLVIVGAGGIGREAIDIVRAMNAGHSKDVFQLAGVIDSSPTTANLIRLNALDVEFVGSEEQWLDANPETDFLYAAAVGTPASRRQIVERFASRGMRAATLIHPQTVIGSNVVLSEGVIVRPGAIISTNATIGPHSHVNTQCVVGHDSVLGAFVSINTGATVAGNVIVEDGCMVGSGANVLQGLRVLSGSIVGAGAVVTKDVPADTVVKGVPAR